MKLNSVKLTMYSNGINGNLGINKGWKIKLIKTVEMWKLIIWGNSEIGNFQKINGY